MTYIQLINRVLREIREKQVQELSAERTLMIGQYVNEAKEEVEDAWQWHALRVDVPFTTVIGQKDYDLSSSTNERAELLYDHSGRPLVYNVTQKIMLSEVPAKIMTQYVVENQMPNTPPSQFSQLRSSTGITLRIYPAPDAVYSMQASIYVPQAELSGKDDVITVPSSPVWRLALARAASERGADQGESPTALEARAKRILDDAIYRDAEDIELTAIPW